MTLAAGELPAHDPDVTQIGRRKRLSARRQLRDLLSGHLGRVALLAAASTGGGLTEAVFLLAVTRAAFAVAGGHSTVKIGGAVTTTVPIIIAAAVAVIAIRLALSAAAAWLSAQLSTQIVASLRRQLAEAYLSATWPAQQDERGGRFQELLTTFANRGADLVVALTQLIIAGCTLVALLLIAVLVDPLSSLAVVAAAGLLALALRPIQSAARQEAESTAISGMTFATALDEISQLGMEMHAFNIQSVLRRRVDTLIGDNESVNRRLNFLRGMVPAIYASLAYLALLFALGIASTVLAANVETVGAVILVMLRSLTYGQAFQANQANIYATLPFIETLGQEVARFRRSELIDQGLPVEKVGPLRLDSVSFSYAPGQAVLHDINLEISPGELIGIVGPSGSGKSTLIQILLGLRSPTEGQASASGVPLSNLSRHDWATKVAYVPQQARLVAGSVSDNIRFMRDGVTQSDVQQAAQMAHLHEEVTALPNGYEHFLGERGDHLSGGQQQRLIIARALAGQPEVLVLDEPTSALDVHSEALIRETLHGLKGSVTVIIVAHRLSTLEICDRIMVIERGRMIEFDSPLVLEESSGFYRESLRISGLR